MATPKFDMDQLVEAANIEYRTNLPVTSRPLLTTTKRNFHDFATLTFVFESSTATERDLLLDSALFKLSDIETRFATD